MPQARFSIGIDLGTTNCAMSFVALEGEGRSEVFLVRQWESLSGLAESSTLPSFLYLPEEAVAAQLQGDADTKGEWIIGRLGRAKAGETPGRVVHSAKSWLCHHAADREAPFLPWGSEEIAPTRKISPVRASGLLLNYLRGAWDARFAASGADFRFDAQEIIVTVPASFDAVAQRLTLKAAEEAGYPKGVRLIEEPQAAFYRWLEAHDSVRELWTKLESAPAAVHHVLVVDIGGGTSDFSLFELSHETGSPAPVIRRVAVSDHILLGGDNIDMALAHLLEQRLTKDGERLAGSQWDHLVARCRDLKERALARDGAGDEAFPVAIPGRGSGLIASSLSASISRAEIDSVLLDGFFPECAADDRPKTAQAGLKEWGLPYAADSAVTRYLAAFLKDRPRVDAVLFNGGTLYPTVLRERLVQQIGNWQQGAAPLVLDNPEPDLAVARGAARFGKLLQRKAERIGGGAARAIFLAARRKASGGQEDASEPALVCLLPQGAAPEESFAIADRALELRLNRTVRFQTYSSTRHAKAQAGDVVDWNARDFHPLPPLETVARLPEPARAKGDRTVPVTLTARLNELGLLQVACVSADPAIAETWPLEFNLRPQERGGEGGTEAVAQVAPNAGAAQLNAARERLRSQFGSPLNKRDLLTATRLLASLEQILGVGKGEWNWALIRGLWPTLEGLMATRATSVEHEETWLILAGFLLRPGFGAPLDEVRIDELWRLRERGLSFPGKRNQVQLYILWRRVAGGLSRERQERILLGEIERLRQGKNLAPELIRLAGSLERIGHELKAELIDRFLAMATQLIAEKKHCLPYLAALGQLLNRAPLYAGPETVVSPELVERAYDAFAGLDWAAPDLAELQTLFLRAARMVDNRALDLPRSLRHRIWVKLEKAGVAPLRTQRLKEAVPIERSERQSLYGESLPPGLILGAE